MPAGAWRQITATWSSPSSPASIAALVSGSSLRRRAMATSRRARPADTPHFHATHCGADRMPAPSHAPVSNTSAISRTSRPTAALITPHTWAISSSNSAATGYRSRVHCIEHQFD